MELIKFNKTSKGKVGGKNYFYNPIVKKDNKYFLCKTIKTPVLLDKKTFDVNSLFLWQEIKPEFYTANGLDPLDIMIETQSGELLKVTSICEDFNFKGIFNGLIGNMNIQFDTSTNRKGWIDFVFCGVSWTYTKCRFV